MGRKKDEHYNENDHHHESSSLLLVGKDKGHERHIFQDNRYKNVSGVSIDNEHKSKLNKSCLNGDYEYNSCTIESNVNNENNVTEQIEEWSYFELVKSNKPFQLYLLSYIVTQMGEWLTYVASIELMEQILGPERSSFSRRYVSYYVICRLMPFLVISPFGGVLADVRDRRKSMIFLDCIGTVPPLMFLLAAHFMSIPLIFIVTILQSSIGALYEPCRNAIIPLLVPDDEGMKKATTLTGLAWSVTAALGAAIGGMIVSSIGIRACFALDAITYLISTLFLFLIGGNWDASKKSSHLSPLHLLHDMIVKGVQYIRSSKFWPIVFVKVSASVIYGGADVLNVSFSEEGHGMNEAKNSRRLGYLFCCVGFGCLIGPIIADRWTSMKNLKSILNSCISAFAIQAMGCLGMGYFKSFALTGFFTIVRSAGSNLAWINSSVLLQSYSKPDMLGRVIAVDYALALTGESLSAMIVGVVQDKLHYSAMEVSLIMGYIALFTFTVWMIYRCSDPQLE